MMPSVSAVRKAGRSRRVAAGVDQKFVDYTFEGITYTLDLTRNKVYRNFMAVETNKGFTILGAYRHQVAIPA